MVADAIAGWLAVVDDDLRQVVNNIEGPALSLVEGPMPSLSGAAYHCQQAAEKLVKAVLTEAAIPFPKIHDIAALVALLPAGHRLKQRLAELQELTPYGVAYRYPFGRWMGDPVSVDDREVAERNQDHPIDDVAVLIQTSGRGTAMLGVLKMRTFLETGGKVI